MRAFRQVLLRFLPYYKINSQVNHKSQVESPSGVILDWNLDQENIIIDDGQQWHNGWDL